MLKILLLEKEIHERFIIVEKVPKVVSIISVSKIDEVIPHLKSKELKAMLIGPSIPHCSYKKIIALYEKFHSSESMIFFSRTKWGSNSIFAEKTFKGHFIYIPTALHETEHILKRIFSRSFELPESFVKDYTENNLFIGTSPKITQVKRFILKYAKSSDPVLIHGETGTGKEIVAKMLHSLSERKEEKCHIINAGAISADLSVSEFFGSTTGAYTGAVGRIGIFEYSNNGTLFIDEIAELSLPIQAELLRVLQDGSVRKIGSNQIKHVNFRLISATNKNIKQEIKNRRFRLDLFHRINTLEIYIPPLRERKDDIPDLLLHFCNELIEEKPELIFSISDSFIDKLFEYDWPGNVRELRNILRRAAFSADQEILTADSISFSNMEFY